MDEKYKAVEEYLKKYHQDGILKNYEKMSEEEKVKLKKHKKKLVLQMIKLSK